jgi:hypothetical protein
VRQPQPDRTLAFLLGSLLLILFIVLSAASQAQRHVADQEAARSQPELDVVPERHLSQRASRGEMRADPLPPLTPPSSSAPFAHLLAEASAEQEAIRERIDAGTWSPDPELSLLDDAAERARERREAAEQAERDRLAAEQAEKDRLAAAERARAARSEPAPAPGAPNPPAPADGSVWDRLMDCEAGSSGGWQANTGNGYYGGLQFSLSSWQAAGGSGYPHQHSRAEQIKRGEILKSMQGWGAWPACSRKLGLR